MRATINTAAGTVQLTCTIGELYLMQTHEMSVYATPTPQGQANQCYLAEHPQYRDDFAIATLDDFLNEAGWTELDDDPEQGTELDEVMITVPRDRHSHLIEG